LLPTYGNVTNGVDIMYITKILFIITNIQGNTAEMIKIRQNTQSSNLYNKQ